MAYADDIRQMQQAGVNAPQFQWGTGPIAGVAGPDYSGQQRALAGLEARALGTGPSAWMTQRLGEQGVEQAGMRDLAAREGAGNLAQARSSLAMRGGLSGGASERAATSGARDIAMRQQETGRQGALQRAQIGVEDERQRLQMLGQLPGAQAQGIQSVLAGGEQQLGTQRFNAGLGMARDQQQNAFNQTQYGQQTAQFGASQMADQIAAQNEAERKKRDPFNKDPGQAGQGAAAGFLTGGPVGALSGAVGGQIGGIAPFLLNPIGTIATSIF